MRYLGFLSIALLAACDVVAPPAPLPTLDGSWSGTADRIAFRGADGAEVVSFACLGEAVALETTLTAERPEDGTLWVAVRNSDGGAFASGAVSITPLGATGRIREGGGFQDSFADTDAILVSFGSFGPSLRILPASPEVREMLSRCPARG